MNGEKIGLPNLASNCYINAIFQIFLHSKELGQCLPPGSTPTSLRRDYCEFAQIGNSVQCDSILFLHYLLDRLQPYHLWQQEWKGTFWCKRCAHTTPVSAHTENIWLLYVPLVVEQECEDENGRVYDFELGQLIHTQLSIEVKKHCDNCKRNTPTTKTTRISSFPDNLFINLQNNKGKCTLVYEDFTITNELEAKVSEQYFLKGFVCHLGSSVDHGHFVVYIKDTDGWTLYDDSTIVKVFNIFAVLSSKANTVTLLWYLHGK
jgi:ubiquitin C-terminal hydrolase